MESPSSFEISVMQYWVAVENFLKNVGSLAQAIKLEENLEDPETNHRVAEVFERYYDGSFYILREAIGYRERDCQNDIRVINQRARGIKVQTVKKPEILIDLLLDRDRRTRWGRIVRQYKKKYHPASLQEVEAEYQRRLKRSQKRDHCEQKRSQCDQKRSHCGQRS